MNKLVFSLSFLLMISFSSSTHGQTVNFSSPPYIVQSSNFMLVNFNLKAEDVQKLLPEKIKVKSNNGMVAAGIEMYSVDNIYGIPKYTMAFIYVEVNDLASNDGSPGHWAIWGNMNNNAALQNMKHFYNFPYTLESKMSIGINGKEYTAIIGDTTTPLLKMKLKIIESQAYTGQGIVNMCARLADGKTIKTEVPWLTQGNNGEVLTFEVNTNTDSVLNLLKDVTPNSGYIAPKQIFSYSKPVINYTLSDSITTVVIAKESLENEVFIFPNPGTGTFTIKGAKSASAYDLTGNLVATTKTETLHIPSKGFYIVKVATRSGEKTFKVLVD